MIWRHIPKRTSGMMMLLAKSRYAWSLVQVAAPVMMMDATDPGDLDHKTVARWEGEPPSDSILGRRSSHCLAWVDGTIATSGVGLPESVMHATKEHPHPWQAAGAKL